MDAALLGTLTTGSFGRLNVFGRLADACYMFQNPLKNQLRGEMCEAAVPMPEREGVEEWRASPAT